MSRSEPRGGVFSWSGIWVDSVRRISIVTYVAHTSMMVSAIVSDFDSIRCGVPSSGMGTSRMSGPLTRISTVVASIVPIVIQVTINYAGTSSCHSIFRTMRMFSDPCRECIILFPENQIRYVRNKVNNRCLISDNSFLSIFSLIVLLY